MIIHKSWLQMLQSELCFRKIICYDIHTEWEVGGLERVTVGRPDGSVGEESGCNAGDTEDASWTSRLGRSPGSPGVGNDNPLLYSYLENFMDSRAWQAVIHGVSKSQTQLSMWHEDRSDKTVLSYLR